MHLILATMQRLLSCASPDSLAVNCCETPYQWVQGDCIRVCLIEAVRPQVQLSYAALANAMRFGLRKQCTPLEIRIQDLQLLIEYLMDIHHQRLVRINAGEDDWTMEELDEEFSTVCVLQYFQDTYKLDYSGLFFTSGVVMPGRILTPAEQLALPVPSNEICSELLPPPIYPPIPDPAPCGTILFVPLVNNNCEAGTFSINVFLLSSLGFGLGVFEYTVNGIAQTPVQSVLGFNVLGPFPNTATVVVNLVNSLALPDTCDQVIGTFTGEIPQDFTVTDAVDAQDAVDATSGTYYIISDAVATGLTIGAIYGFGGTPLIATPALGDIILLTINGNYYEVVAPGPGDLMWQHPPVLLTQNLTTPYWVATIPLGLPPSMIGTQAVIEYTSDGVNWQFLWTGDADDLLAGVDFDDPTLLITDVRITYSNTLCPVTTPGEIRYDGDIETDCTAIEDVHYQYVDDDTNSILITANPGETIDLMWIAGTMGAGVVIQGYDGPDNTGIPIPALTGNFPTLNGISVTTTTNQLFIQIDAVGGTDGEAVLQTPWWFQVVCTQGDLRPAGTAQAIDDCDTTPPTFSVSGEVLDVGDMLTVTVRYIVNGGTPVDVPGFVAFDPFLFGPFAYGDQVLVLLLHTNPLSNVTLGLFTAVGDCESIDPCAPDIALKVDRFGDLSDLPPFHTQSGWGFFVVSDVVPLNPNPLGAQVGDFIVWNSTLNIWELGSYAPGIISNGTIFYYTTGPGAQPYLVFPLVYLWPSSTTPNNWFIWIRDINLYGLVTDRQLRIQVRNGFFGTWTTIWSGLEQQLAGPFPIQINNSFTHARVEWDYGVCGFFGGAMVLTSQPPLNDPPVLTRIEVSFEDDDPINPGDTKQAFKYGFDQFNNPFPAVPGVWSIDSGNGTVDQNGVVTASLIAGPYLIIVRYTSGSVFSTAAVLVN